VAIAYLAASWLLIEVAETIFTLFGFGNTLARLVVILLAIGFPLFLVFSWLYELTPEGLKLEKDVDRIGPAQRFLHGAGGDGDADILVRAPNI